MESEAFGVFSACAPDLPTLWWGAATGDSPWWALWVNEVAVVTRSIAGALCVYGTSPGCSTVVYYLRQLTCGLLVCSGPFQKFWPVESWKSSLTWIPSLPESCLPLCKHLPEELGPPSEDSLHLEFGRPNFLLQNPVTIFYLHPYLSGAFPFSFGSGPASL